MLTDLRYWPTCRLEKWRQAQGGFSCLIDTSILSREESKSPAIGTRALCINVNNSEVTQKDDTKPIHQPMLQPSGNGKAGHAWQQSLLGLKCQGHSSRESITWPTWDQSSMFPASVILTLTTYLSPRSRSCFRCQSLSLALCLEVYKKYQGYQARQLTYQTTTLQARGTTAM